MKSLTKHLFLLIAFLALINCVKAQVGIGTTQPKTSVVLEVKSLDKGILIPRPTNYHDAVQTNGSFLYDSISNKFKYCVGEDPNGKWYSVNPLTTNEAGDNITVEGQLNIVDDLNVSGDALNAPAATVTASKYVGFGTVPIGGIIMWSGNINNLPENWKLCDGGTYSSVVTPNLQGKFILGFDQNNPNAVKTGGSDQITLNSDQMPRHTHDQGTLVNAVAGKHRHTYDGFRNVKDGTSEEVKSRNEILSDPTDWGGALAGDHTHQITGLTGLTGGKIVRYDQDLSGSPTHYFIYEPGCSEESQIWEWIDEGSGKGHWVSNPNYYLDNPACINPAYNPNYGNWNIPVWEAQPFDNRPAYYILAFIMRVQ